uniref:Phosphoribosyltransferase domain-containing protein n=1 Tax=Salix viminalis TaxID=40686 RepID=A0A6N2LFT8_SALVM
MTRSQGRFYLLLVRNPALLHVVGPVSTALDGFLSDLMGQIMKVTMVRDFRIFLYILVCLFFCAETKPLAQRILPNNILPCFESGIPLLKNRLQELPDSDNIAIAFPDDGAWKRFHKQLQHFPTIICAKVREGDQRIVRIKEGNPQGRHAVIVDDLVQSGGTLVECQWSL